MSRNCQSRCMFRTYDERKSTNDSACLRYMLNNNSNNNTMYVECLLSTFDRVCVCVCTNAKYLPRHASRHHRQSCTQNKLPVSVLRCFVSPQPSLFKPPCKFASKLHPASKSSVHILDVSECLIETLWLQIGGAAPAQPPPPASFSTLPRPRVCEKLRGGFSSLKV